MTWRERKISYLSINNCHSSLALKIRNPEASILFGNSVVYFSFNFSSVHHREIKQNQQQFPSAITLDYTVISVSAVQTKLDSEVSSPLLCLMFQQTIPAAFEDLISVWTWKSYYGGAAAIS